MLATRAGTRRAGACVLTGALAAWTVRRADREYRERGALGRLTSVTGWVAYLAHGVLVAHAARSYARPLAISRRHARAIGAALIGAGGALYLGGFPAFSSLPLISGTSNERLVTGGVYRISRHPQNVGWVLALTGVGLASRSGRATLLANALWPVFAPYARIEERHLLRVHGEAYERYQRSTARWLGLPASTGGRAT